MYAQIRKMDISNGPGIRVSVFFQGCAIKCPGCFNESIWNFDEGKEFTQHTIDYILDLCKSDHVAGLSILGGEPLHERNRDDVKNLITQFRNRYPHKTIWMWTGYVFENLTDAQREVAMLVDTLVDGPFILARAIPGAKYRGSDNQRIIDIKSLT